MMGCEGVRELAQELLDGALGAAQRERLERHLSACPACRRIVAEYQALFAILPRPAAPQVPPTLAARTLARVAAARRWRRAWQAAALAAALLVAAGVSGIAAWDALWPAIESLSEADVSLGSWWSAARASASELVEDVAAAGGAWMAMAPSGAAAAAVVLAAFAAQLLLVHRWRALARPDAHGKERAVR